MTQNEMFYPHKISKRRYEVTVLHRHGEINFPFLRNFTFPVFP